MLIAVPFIAVWLAVSMEMHNHTSTRWIRALVSVTAAAVLTGLGVVVDRPVSWWLFL